MSLFLSDQPAGFIVCASFPSRGGLIHNPMRIPVFVPRLFSAFGGIAALHASPLITEFMAINDSSLEDEDGEFSDWIEIHNPDESAINLSGWHLTDDPSDLTKWTFPAVTVQPGTFLIVFASDKDRENPAGELHTNFRLSGGGEFLALVMPDGLTTTTSFAPYPQQVADVGYGLNFSLQENVVLSQGHPMSVHVPDAVSGPALGQDWWLLDYAEGEQGETWGTSSSGVGFGSNYLGLIGTGGDLSASMLDVNSSVYLRSEFVLNSLDEIDGLTLRLNYDDGFVAYLNGEEVAQANVPSGGGAPESGLVALYDFEGDLDDDADEFTNGSGVASDDLTAFGSGTYQAGVVGQAVRISAGGFQRLLASDSNDLDLAPNWTLEAFVRPDSGNTGEWDRFWTKWGDGSNDWHWTFRGANNGLDLFINNSINILNQGATAAVPLNQWSHIAMVGNQAEGTITAWLNGVEVGSATWQPVSGGGGSMSFGNFESVANGLQFSGLIDEAAIWKVALTPAQLAAHAAAISSSPATSAEAYGLTPLGVTSGLDWRSSALVDRPDSDALEPVEIDLSSRLSLLQNGTNVLAIHGLNASDNADHFLISPELDLPTLSAQPATAAYLPDASPGRPNPSSTSNLGPIVGEIVHTPLLPGSGDNITITAPVTESLNSLGSVNLVYRVNFGAEQTLPMSLAPTGEYSATIPSSAFDSSDMVRWRIVAIDSEGEETQAPAYLDPDATPQYEGTVISADEISSDLAVFHWFVESPSAAETGSGTRASVFFNGEFYDNVFVRIRGDTARSWPKKSYKFDFNDGFDFRFDPDLPRVDEINVNTTYTDKSYSRTLLAYETFRDAGSPYSISFPLRVQQNGEFYSVALFVEQPDRDYLRRNNLGDEGALYKAKANSVQGVGAFNRPATSGMEKKNRRDEDFSDLQSLIDSLALTGDDLDHYLFDNIDLPSVVNNLAANVVIQNIDRTVKNFYLHRDTAGTGEWMILPWDVDLSFGPNALNTNAIVTSEDIGNNSSHPFMGTSSKPYTSLWNGLIDAIIDRPDTREMFLRRLGTLSQGFLNSNYYDDRLDQLALTMGPDVALDRARWGNSAHFPGTTLPLDGEIDRIRNEYLPGRRNHLFQFHGGTGGSGLVLLPESSAVTALVPRDGSLGSSWQLSGYDDSAWLSGVNAVGYERSASQTYTNLLGLDLLSSSIPAALRIDSDGDNLNDNNSCYLRYRFNLTDRNVVEFLKLRVKYDDGFVAFLNGSQIAARNSPIPLLWNSEASGQNPDGEAVVFEDIDVMAFKSLLLDGENILAVQAMNRGSNSSDMLFSMTLIDESFGSGSGVGIPGSTPLAPPIQFGAIDFNPASGVQDEEFIELINPNSVAVDLTDWQLSGGVEITLKPGTVIPAGGSLYLSPDSNFFRARASAPTGGEGNFVQGPYEGHLSNLGEILTLSNPQGDVITETMSGSDPSDTQLFLVVSEVHYHPAGDPGEEFIELTNISASVTLDLTGVSFVDGVNFDFSGVLAPGARILVVRNLVAFESKYGSDLPVVGQFANSTNLNNDGETIKLEDALSGTIAEFTYNDNTPWPESADGAGASLVLINPSAMPDPDLATNWRPSAFAGGNPGGTDSRRFVGDPNADLNGNGVGDLVDHFLFEDSSPRLVTGNQGVSFTFDRDLQADDVDFEVEISTDLVNWTDGSAIFEVVDVNDPGDGRRSLTFFAGPESLPDEKLFVRLKVSLSPR